MPQMKTFTTSRAVVTQVARNPIDPIGRMGNSMDIFEDHPQDPPIGRMANSMPIFENHPHDPPTSHLIEPNPSKGGYYA